MIAGGLLIICAFRISSAAKGVVDEPVDYEPFDVPLPELEKESKKMTTLTHQCAAFKQHYRYYCKTCENVFMYTDPVMEIIGLILPDTMRKFVSFANAMISFVRIVFQLRSITWYQKCKEFWKPLPDLTPYPKGEFAPPPLARGVYFAYDPLGNYKTFNIPRDHGVSFWRGTQSTVVNWPEGKISGATTWDVPFMGIEGIFNAYEVGFPNYAAAAKDFQRKFPDPGTGSLNPGTGRA
ncbi:hypothetical protein QR680_000043 [Steinernema hermaphroditum]|uniref:Uncharacterized protein n=1 Tax=Steinernema hermaphroditum TaxID=289476 RepID=A0AA39GT36_9BILA|nr:hypothetical protein QR680_000043 [Steinernema hermaphroditum]